MTRFSKGFDMNSLITRTRLFDDIFKDFPAGYFVRPLHGDPLPDPRQIKIDVKDNGDAFVIHADIPGVNKEDLHIDIEGPLVSLRAEVNQIDHQTKDDQTGHTERYSGVVARSFNLPADVDKDKAKAKYENGVLTLTLPKAGASKSKRIQVD